MAILVNAHRLAKAFAGRPLFTDLSLGIEDGDRIGLIGANGTGKSTLLKIIGGLAEADEGKISRQAGLRIGYLSQNPTLNLDQGLRDALLSGVNAKLHPDAAHDWECISRAEELISRFEFDRAGADGESRVRDFSGGWRKRVALARELMGEPTLLLLDEPTNHLDVESIEWLEEFLSEATFATLTVTHDRYFLNEVANKIWELDPRNDGGLLTVVGNYGDYITIRDELIANQKRREWSLSNTLRRETEWLRRGARARTTKQSARIQRHGELASEVERLSTLNRNREVNFGFQAESGPKKLIDAKGISKSYDGREVFSQLDLVLSAKSRLGIIGRNGAGKSTLIRVLLGIEEPDTGEVKHAEALKVAYFEQNREVLDPDDTVLKSICPQGDHVKYRGNFVHIRSYLDRFLFGPAQMDQKVAKLSGGEQARLLVARLMLKEANVLVLDEPTNDLDIVTLGLLEDALIDFDGAVILVTHDRYFMEQVASQVITIDQGRTETFAGVAQWMSLRQSRAEARAAATTPTPAPKAAKSTPAKAKLSYKDQRELDLMESVIAKAEAKVTELSEASGRAPSQSGEQRKIFVDLAAAQKEVEALYKRWEELLAMSSKTDS